MCFLADIQGLKAADQVEELQDEAQLILADYIWSRLPAQPARFGKILLSVAALRSLAEKPIEHLFFSSVPAKDMFESILSQVISSNWMVTEEIDVLFFSRCRVRVSHAWF